MGKKIVCEAVKVGGVVSVIVAQGEGENEPVAEGELVKEGEGETDAV